MTKLMEVDVNNNSTGKKNELKNINFNSLEALRNFGWKLVHVSHEMSISEWYDSRMKKSTFVYQNPNNLNEGIRIYEDFADYKYTSHNDDRLIEKLKEKQPNIKLTQFPIGVVMICGKVIGQIIPYYHGYYQISVAVKSGVSKERFYDYIRKIVDIFKELIDNDIYYTDIHSGNILVNLDNDDIQLIDFESFYLNIRTSRDFPEKYYYDILNSLCNLFNNLGESLGIKLIDNAKDIKSFDDLYNIIPKNDKSLIKR